MKTLLTLLVALASMMTSVAFADAGDRNSNTAQSDTYQYVAIATAPRTATQLASDEAFAVKTIRYCKYLLPKGDPAKAKESTFSLFGLLLICPLIGAFLSFAFYSWRKPDGMSSYSD